MSSRLGNAPTEDKFRKKVLIGNWFERRCKFSRNPHNFKSTYGEFFTPKPRCQNDPAFVWDQIYKGQGYGPRVLFDHQAPHFLENKSTTYDIAYRHIPKGLKGPVPRTLRVRFHSYEPQQDYAQNYGNITRSGLLDYYKEKWPGEVMDPRMTLKTSYQDTFVAPTGQDYKFMRWGIPIPNSSIMVKTNTVLSGWHPRSKQILFVPENELKQMCHKPRCNIITWECPTPYKEVPDRCVVPYQQPKRRKRVT